MTKPRDPDALLLAFLADGMEILPDRVVDSVLDEVHRTRQRAVFGPWRTRAMIRTTVVAAVVVAVVALGSALFAIQRGQPAVGGPSPTAGASSNSSQPAVVAPSGTSGVTPRPSPTVPVFLWSQSSLDEDWPAPVRAEPVGGAIVRPARQGDYEIRLADPAGDAGSSVLPWADIRELQGTLSSVEIYLAKTVPPALDPTAQWVAYGVVLDTDRDGIPDWRYGVDNMPVDATGMRSHRAWRTNLHTGRTESAAGPPYGELGNIYFDTFYPGEGTYVGNRARLSFGGNTTGGGTGGSKLPAFYAWASVIVDGRVVATDYAPDVGWLDPSLKAKP